MINMKLYPNLRLVSKEQMEAYAKLTTCYQKVLPDFLGAVMKTEDSVRMQLAVIDSLVPEHNGQFLSYRGNKDML